MGRGCSILSRVSLVVMLLCGLAIFVPATTVCRGQATTDEPPPEDSADAPVATLDGSQDSISIRYRRFEKTLLQMAEFMRKTDPDRAELLVRAIGRSKEDRIVPQMEQVVKLLRSDQLGDALEQQNDLIGGLQGILDLLQSEDRKDYLAMEKERIKDLLKDLGRVINQEIDVRSRTERGQNSGKLAERQDKIARDTERLGNKIDAQDAERRANDSKNRGDRTRGDKNQSDKKADGEDSKDEEDAKKGDKPQDKKDEKSSEENDGEKSSQDGKSGEQSGKSKSGKKSGDKQKSKPGESSDENKDGEQSPDQNGKSGEQDGDNPPSPEERADANRTPGREEIEQARNEMERAIEELKKQKREEASDRQDQAIAELEKAKAQLEEFLRQLREEERGILLAALEARFQKMLAAQMLVHNATVSLAAVPEKEWASRHASKAVQLARDENQIAVEAEKTLGILKEEGSSVAFPEVVEQLRDDMLIVAHRLERSEVGELTQSSEEDIIEALEELIEALQREMEKGDKRQSQDQQQSGPAERALVDMLAELKMLRSLQLRVNRRTRQLGRMINGEQATESEIVEEIRRLGERQTRIQEATYDLSVGKNK